MLFKNNSKGGVTCHAMKIHNVLSEILSVLFNVLNFINFRHVKYLPIPIVMKIWIADDLLHDKILKT